MTETPAGRVQALLDLVGELEWARFRLSDDEHTPNAPLVVWRYKEEPDWFARLLLEAARSYRGAVEWTIQKPGRNWVLWPTKAETEFEEQSGMNDAFFLTDFSRREPEFCKLASADLWDLVAHLETAILER